MPSTAAGQWLFLIHQIPPRPNYLRVKIWRQLQRIGAVAIKKSVYVLPRSDQALEDFQWVLREIREGGGDGLISDARLVEGLADERVMALFTKARNTDFGQIAKAARTLVRGNPPAARLGETKRRQVAAEIRRLRKRHQQVVAIDFFRAPDRQAVDRLLTGLEARIRKSPGDATLPESVKRMADFHHRIWVTRQGIHVDRMASAWLIRRFIDTEARFKFVPEKDYHPRQGEVRFDMFEAEFTHEGDRCTFEVLLRRFGMTSRALVSIAEIVHDIDLKDFKFGRRDAPGLERLITGIGLANKEDGARLESGSAVFDALYEVFRRNPD